MDKLLGPTTTTTECREDHQSWLSKYFAKVHENLSLAKNLIQLDQLHLVSTSTKKCNHRIFFEVVRNAIYWVMTKFHLSFFSTIFCILLPFIIFWKKNRSYSKWYDFFYPFYNISSNSMFLVIFLNYKFDSHMKNIRHVCQNYVGPTR